MSDFQMKQPVTDAVRIRVPKSDADLLDRLDGFVESGRRRGLDIDRSKVIRAALRRYLDEEEDRW